MGLEFGEHFAYPGEDEIVKIMDPEATVLTPVHIMSKTRPAILTKITKSTISKNPRLALESRRKRLSLYAEEAAHSTTNASNSSGKPWIFPEDHTNKIIAGSAEFDWYDWRHCFTNNNELNLDNIIEEQAYTLFFIICIKKADDLKSDVMAKNGHMKKTDKTKLKYKLKTRRNWNPVNPKYWKEDSFPFLVQTNDYRYHIAIDHETLLICPNIETAYYTWNILSVSSALNTKELSDNTMPSSSKSSSSPSSSSSASILSTSPIPSVPQSEIHMLMKAIRGNSN